MVHNNRGQPTVVQNRGWAEWANGRFKPFAGWTANRGWTAVQTDYKDEDEDDEVDDDVSDVLLIFLTSFLSWFLCSQKSVFPVRNNKQKISTGLLLSKVS